MERIDIILITHQKKEDVQGQIDEIEKNTPQNHRLIATCQPFSAAVNRNYGLSWANSGIIVMVDDDMTGFYMNWLEDFVIPMENSQKVILSSARLLNLDRTVAHMMGAANIPKEAVGIHEAQRFAYKNYYRVATACIAIRKNDIRFNEEFLGSGYEDTFYMNSINEKFPNNVITVNCNCKLIHKNEEKNQGGSYWEHNKKTYLKYYPDDQTVLNQKEWTLRKR